MLEAVQLLLAEPCVNLCCRTHLVRGDLYFPTTVAFALGWRSPTREVVWVWDKRPEVTGKSLKPLHCESIRTMGHILSSDAHYPEPRQAINEKFCLLFRQRFCKIDVEQPASHFTRT